MSDNPALALALMALTGFSAFGCGADSQPGSSAETDTGGSSGTTSMRGTSSGPTTQGTTHDELTTTETDTVFEPSSGGREMACEGACVPSAPEGWSGPVARIVLPEGATEDSACGGGFPESAATGFSTLDPVASDCGCSCGTPMGGACESEIDVDVFDARCNVTTAGGGCIQPGANFTSCSSVDETLSVGSDAFVDDDSFGIRVIVSPPAVASAPSCAPSDDSVLSPPVPRDEFELCTGPAEAGACAGEEVCTAQLLNPFDEGACIWVEGESDCPESDYTERTLLHDSLEDTRECSPCSCAAAAGTSCVGDIEVVAAYGSGGLVVDPAEVFAADGACSTRITPNATPAAAVNFTVSYDPQAPTSSSCQPSGGNLTGEVAPAGTRTVCCQPS